MKKILFALLCVGSLVTWSCQGPQGPVGPEGLPGPQGPQGTNVLSAVFDITGSFNANNDYRIYFDFPPAELEVFDTDAVFVYRLWETVQDPGQAPVPVYRLLPQTVFLPQGLMQYSFDHSFLDVSVFIDAQFNLSGLASQWTQNQRFRVVVLPADFAANGRQAAVDMSNYEEVKKHFNLQEKDIPTYQAKQK
ncbi:hypothetical protein GCM10027275_11790 [Rhabdobacter roseus]|uniref:Collagen-like protein n=1 Tax=Rhabdobacter roseus TaxID=1655419 RepID=A0A840TIE2_9BACT|nr:collagen-like protein [Rhabdobacter roseus]MBB5283091.1 hypothetical protein [Rhabdobacter roseus]